MSEAQGVDVLAWAGVESGEIIVGPKPKSSETVTGTLHGVFLRFAPWISIVVLAGCAGHSRPERVRTIADTKAAFVHQGIKLVSYPGRNGDSTPFFEGLRYSVYVAVYPTVRAAQAREQLYRQGFPGQSEYRRSRNVFATWHGRTRTSVTAALDGLR